MTRQNLSKIKRFPLRSVWPTEDRNFTPWLAEHIGELGKALGIELETQERESSVGGRSLDIMATDSSGRPVIIENQLEGSDVDHLGRLLIYTAGKDADVIIWIAKNFKDEHQQVLQWLNQRTNSKTNFFGVAIEVWTIDDSRPAPYFRVVAAPNDWLKQNVVPPKKRYREFREKLEEEIKLKLPDLPLQPGGKNNNRWLAIDHADGLQYSIDFPGKILFSFQLDTRKSGQSLEWCRSSFDRLQKDKESIEEKLGELEWKREWQRTRGSCIVSHYQEGFSDFSDSWDEIHRWAIDRYRLFREVFEPYREELLSSPLSHTTR